MPALTGRQIVLRPNATIAAGGWQPWTSGDHWSNQDDPILAPTSPPSDGSSLVVGSNLQLGGGDGVLRLGLTPFALSSNEFVQRVDLWAYAYLVTYPGGTPVQLELGLTLSSNAVIKSGRVTSAGGFQWLSTGGTLTEDQSPRDLSALRVYEKASLTDVDGRDSIEVAAAYVVLATAYRNPMRACA